MNAETVESARPVTLGGIIPGVNADKVDVLAGLRKLSELGWPEKEHGRTHMVIQYALQRWARGEEKAAEQGAIDLAYFGIPMTSWRVVLAAAVWAGEHPEEAAARLSVRQRRNDGRGPGFQLTTRYDNEKRPRAILRVYGFESIHAMNQIARALNKRPAEILAGWIATTHAELVDAGRIDPNEKMPDGGTA